MSLSRTSLSVLAVLAAGPAFAQCAVEGAGSARILTNDFAALRVIGEAAQECASDSVTVEVNHTTEHKNIQVPALTADPAEYTVAAVANNSIVPLLGDDLIRPLDDLVAQYGSELTEQQLIRIDGKIMAIAFMANGQHLVMRRDLVEQAGLQPPTSYEEVLAVAEALKSQGLSETPLAQPNGGTWDIAAEFVNLYLGTGAEFFEPGTATLAIDNEQGRLVLQTMQDLTQYMSPENITYDTDATAQLYRDGQAAIQTNWGSLAASLIDPEQAQPEVAENTVFAAAPTIGGGTIPAAALWWDGFTVAKNISDEDAAVSFQVMMHAIRPEIAQQSPEAAVWLLAGYEPGPAAVGVIANAQAGARPYPMVPWMGLLHEVLGAELPDFVKGVEDADKAIADITAAYTAAAQQAGYLQ